MRPFLSRRDFIQQATCAGAMLACAGRVAAAGGMYVSLNGSLTRGVSGADKIRLAARIGYGGVDWDFGPARADGVEQIRALFTELKIAPTIVNLPMARPLPFGGEEAEFEQALTQLAADASFTAAVGCNKMMLVLSPTGPQPKDEYRKVVRDRLAAVSEVLLRSKIRLGLEFLGVQSMRTGPGRPGGPPRHPFIWTLPETVDLAKECGPNIGAVLDVWHWHHSGGTTAEIAATDPGRIVHVHLSDAKPQAPEEVRDNQRLMPGEGIINLTGFLAALKTIGYQDGVSPEPLGRIPEAMSPEDGARLGLETTVAAMKAAGVQ